MTEKTRKRKQQKTPRTCVLVLGMHRSGTSALSGVLSLLGADIPATPMDAHEMNPKGFFESKTVWKFHEDLLASAGSSWNDWQRLNPEWFASSRADDFLERALDVLDDEFGASRLFVLKDPRICRLMPFWNSVLEAAKIKPAVMHIHRNPLEVAASLQRRDGFDPGYSHLLWLRHVLDAEQGSRSLPRTFTSFANVMTTWPQLIKGSQKTLGLKWPRVSDKVASEIDSFLTPGLRHHAQSVSDVLDNPLLSDWLRETLEILERWSAQGENKADHAALDRIRQGLDHAGPAFATLVSNGKTARNRIAKIEAKLAKQVRSARQAALDLDASQAAITGLKDQLAQAQKTLQQHSTELEQSRDEASQQRDRMRFEQADALRQMTGKLDTATAERDAARTKIAEVEAQLASETRSARQAALDLEASEDALTRLKDELAQTDSALRQRSAELEQSYHSALEADRHLEQVRREHAAVLDDMTAQLEAREAGTVSSTEKIGKLEQSLRARSEDVARLERLGETTRAQLTSEREKSSAVLAQTETDLANARDAVSRHAAEVQEKSARIAAQNIEIARQQEAHRADLDDLSDQLLQRTIAATRSDAKAAELDADMAVRFRELAALTRLLHENDNLAQAERQSFETRLTSEKEQMAEQMTEQMTLALENERRRGAQALTDQQQTYEARLTFEKEQMAKDLEAETERRKVAEDDSNAIQTSRSWRLTAPLRKISTALRRVIKT